VTDPPRNDTVPREARPTRQSGWLRRDCLVCGGEVRGLAVVCPHCGALAFPQQIFLKFVFWIIVLLLPLLVYQLRIR
jgi:hypothetical protein